MTNARQLLAFFTLLSFSTSDRLPQICSVDEYTSSFNTTLPVYGSLPWLIYPMSKQQFLTSYYQQIPIYFQRRNHTYYHHSKQNKMNDWRLHFFLYFFCCFNFHNARHMTNKTSNKDVTFTVTCNIFKCDCIRIYKPLTNIIVLIFLFIGPGK